MVEIDVNLVERLIAVQYPDWSDLPVRSVAESGWDNRTFRLGDTMSVRLPSAERYVAQVEKENRWLPYLARQLPVPIPAPVALGSPGAGYPWPWAIYGWIEGETAKRERIADMSDFATDLADFLLALWKIDAADGPPAGQHNFFRGGTLAVYDAETRQAISILADELDVPLVTEIWERALASRWDRPPVWVHGDVSEGNMLITAGRLSAVIDFGTCGVGDPACDLVIAWTLLDDPAAQLFRRQLAIDGETWERARGSCLWKALIKIVELRDMKPGEADIYRRWMVRVTEDHRRQVAG